MFPLHDKTRRRLAFAAFFLFCLLPTCAITGWCWWRNMSWETQLAAEQLQQQLGWKVKLKRLVHPRPGTDVYENLEFLDPETDRSIFFCNFVEVSRRPVPEPQTQNGSAFLFAFDRAEISADAIPQIHELIERTLKGQVARGMNIHFSSSKLIIKQGNSKQVYPHVVGGTDHSLKYVQAALQFRLPDAKTSEPVTLRLYRDRTTTPPKNYFELIGTDNEVPSELIALMEGEKEKRVSN